MRSLKFILFEKEIRTNEHNCLQANSRMQKRPGLVVTQGIPSGFESSYTRVFSWMVGFEHLQ